MGHADHGHAALLCHRRERHQQGANFRSFVRVDLAAIRGDWINNNKAAVGRILYGLFDRRHVAVEGDRSECLFSGIVDSFDQPDAFQSAPAAISRGAIVSAGSSSLDSSTTPPGPMMVDESGQGEPCDTLRHQVNHQETFSYARIADDLGVLAEWDFARP